MLLPVSLPSSPRSVAFRDFLPPYPLAYRHAITGAIGTLLTCH
jgi:hypothetical protein